MSLLAVLLIIYICIIFYQNNIISTGQNIFLGLYYNYYQRDKLLCLFASILSSYYVLSDISNYDDKPYLMNNTLLQSIMKSYSFDFQNSFHYFYTSYIDYKKNLNEPLTALYQPRTMNKISTDWNNIRYESDYISEAEFISYSAHNAALDLDNIETAKEQKSCAPSDLSENENLVIEEIKLNGKKVINNKGFNTPLGVTAFLVDSVSIFNKQKCDIAVIETDELTSKKILKHITPDYMIIINLFRDSIKNNANPDFIRDKLLEAIPHSSKLIINADDPLCVTLSNKNTIYFGMQKLITDSINTPNIVNDVVLCPKCGEKLTYEYYKYHHIGKFEVRYRSF